MHRLKFSTTVCIQNNSMILIIQKSLKATIRTKVIKPKPFKKAMCWRYIEVHLKYPNSLFSIFEVFGWVYACHFTVVSSLDSSGDKQEFDVSSEGPSCGIKNLDNCSNV